MKKINIILLVLGIIAIARAILLFMNIWPYNDEDENYANIFAWIYIVISFACLVTPLVPKLFKNKNSKKENNQERINLDGTKIERIRKALFVAGWVPNRKVDIPLVLDYYKKYEIELSNKAIEFFQEFYGIASEWYVENSGLNTLACFEFCLCPYKELGNSNVTEFMDDEEEMYQKIKTCANENVVWVGEIGYVYPAFVWIGDSGKIYCKHDYEEEIRVFDSLIEMIEYEVSGINLDFIIIKKQ